ncbi:MAG: hypothetical protein KC563_10245 [Nitrospira sp.]|nr:hypothetical protein [Nitrospira sp.]
MIAIQHILDTRVRLKGWMTATALFGVGMGWLISGSLALAQESDIPWECSEYSGEAQTRCMRTLLELQQDKITKLEEQLKAQEGTVSELKEKVDRQEARAYQQDPRWPPPPYSPAYSSPYGYSYRYVSPPPVGIYIQPPWRVPRYYGYGPRYCVRPGLSFNFRFGGGHRHRH